MNIEQAVQNLEDIKSKYTWSIGADDALDMAISALRAQNLQQTCNQLATNTIDRQVAIDAILREYNKEDSDFPTDYQLGLSAAKKIIEQLPSTQLIAIASPDNWDEKPKFYPEDWRDYAVRRTNGVDH